MNPRDSAYSPNIIIYLEIAQKRIRLSDVLHDSATLFEIGTIEVPPGTEGELVFQIDSSEEREPVILRDGISITSKLISFTYPQIAITNGPYNKRMDLR